MSRQLNTVLLHGGGLDSTAVFLYLVSLGIDFDCLSVDYGHVAFKAELEAIAKQCLKYGVPLVQTENTSIKKLNGECMLFSGNPEHTPVVSGRNLLLVTTAVEAGYKQIYLGLDKPANNAVPWPDASPEFVNRLNGTLALSFGDVNVKAPFIDVPKEEVFKNALRFDSSFFDMSMTCWTPTSTGDTCGVCKHCILEKTYRDTK